MRKGYNCLLDSMSKTASSDCSLSSKHIQVWSPDKVQFENRRNRLFGRPAESESVLNFSNFLSLETFRLQAEESSLLLNFYLIKTQSLKLSICAQMTTVAISITLISCRPNSPSSLLASCIFSCIFSHFFYLPSQTTIFFLQSPINALNTLIRTCRTWRCKINREAHFGKATILSL